MAEVTRVPLQPIAKGSLTKIWLGVIAVLLVAALAAFALAPKGVTVTELQAGIGGNPGPDDVVFVKYVGKLTDGTEFDRSQEMNIPVQGLIPEGTPMILSQVVPGFAEGLLKMQKGGKYEIEIPADKAYGANPPPGSPIPPNSTLIFEVELVDFMNQEDAQRRFQMLQQLMQQAQQAGENGGQNPGAPPAQ